ncbi:PD-(D/E)XK nuclease family protein [Roseateles saccharophilus]|uniref:ATP-dependent helicase/nuclease subunit B n=1 Tax=Roseateles saccharophilus TaxID=304 RepID=A0A4R3ULC4_ROSSA|nr:PD-(D/E)XK nuclease family protein [Roseateles saccharophilus]MDG0834167.1 PD-(D/E)XK nuclease family protein [Roseateles saccharophilus]TCU91311.1 ATP-dependent helicase/nuclease subunit B [Roseateles saccharophilus]
MQALKLGLVAGEDIDAFWRRVAAVSADWLAGQGAPLRDAVLLLPFAQQLVPARRAFLARGGWMPRISTSHSLASALGPSALAAPDQLSGDAAIDAFTADRLLAGQSWIQPLRRSSPRDYRVALARLVDTAQALARAAAQVPPEARPAFLDAARQRLTTLDAGPGLLERALAQVALAWVAADERRPATDTLFALRPSAWIWLRAGGPDPLAEGLLAGGVPALCLDADLDLDEAWAGFTPSARVEEAVAPDFEALAAQAATAVIQHLNAGRRPVALLAQDRVVIRRVRALLARQGLPVHDETGWTLATTPAAAAVMALLRAALAGGALDDWLAWMKSALAAGWDVEALEARCRRFGWRQAAQLDAAMLPPAQGALWQRARRQLEPLAGGARSLGGWLVALGQALNGLAPLAEVEGGEALLETLWISRNPWAGSAHEAALAQTRLRPDEFLVWVDDTLESAQFEPAQEVGAAEVVITPLARAMLRPFGAIVLPGADAATLGPVTPQTGLLADADAAALGLPSLAERREAEAQGFAQLLRAPVLTLLRCAFAGAEPLPPSPLLERLAGAAARAGLALPAWLDEREPVDTSPRPQVRPAADAAGRLPAALSASAIDALRNCPYQFFSRVLLGLREADELEQELSKRDYGTWLHAVLKRFHEARGDDDDAALRAAAAAELALLDAADFLPFSAAFERLCPLYLAWLAEIEATGQRYAAGELDREARPFQAPLDPLMVKGRIDRIDDSPTGTWLLDYKTGDAKGLKAKVAARLEDTQLATYALLSDAVPGLRAAYLVLDDGKGVELLSHEDVSDTALALRDGLQADLMAIRDGTPLPALGEGKVCDFCEARGLCRRDDWSPL